MYMPTLSEAKAIAEKGEYKTIPVSCEMYSDICTPIEVLKKLRKISGNCFILESSQEAQHPGRYTFLGFQPILELSCLNGRLTIRAQRTNEFEAVNPDDCIKKVMKENKSPKFDYLPPFTGGLVGYFAYDYIKYGEPSLHLQAKDDENFKDMDLMLFDKVIAFDNFRHKIILIVNAEAADIEESYPKAVQALEFLKRIIKEGESIREEKLILKAPVTALFSKEKYCRMVETAKEYIRQGDIFQVVLSNRFEAPVEGSLLDLYRVIRTINPSPYMFFFSSNNIEIAGASPETLVKVENNKVSTFPLAGTRLRGKTKEEDLELEKELLADEKELAEHNMLVDLGRNDVGKVSRFGTVKVGRYLEIQRFSHVMHIGSTVEGLLKEDKDAVDAVNAILPAGTLSGAPKFRACEIINELEDNKRGIYGGAIGYLSLNGELDTCIAIRLAFKKNGKVFIRSGAGIVADSVPEREYEECLNKAKVVLNALELSKGGLE
ncbi:MAG: anthranilate synthase component I [Clostridiales bacterium]|uniref:anthranilate synthase component I n=1 Tax=Aminipila sp. TaxID=2060095 RepID=UPI001DBE1180|nr:anthranilate synthase component I [Aminipila sp.]MBE6034218.1 anthranilate synthase component I [Clostridiales bacterium]